MLSLYDKNFKLPELLPNYHKLFIEKMQGPLALLPPTSDEEVVRIDGMPFHDFLSSIDVFVSRLPLVK